MLCNAMNEHVKGETKNSILNTKFSRLNTLSDKLCSSVLPSRSQLIWGMFLIVESNNLLEGIYLVRKPAVPYCMSAVTFLGYISLAKAYTVLRFTDISHCYYLIQPFSQVVYYNTISSVYCPETHTNHYFHFHSVACSHVNPTRNLMGLL